MGLHRTLADHDADPPSVWQVVKVADRCWHLDSSLGGTIGSYTARKAAEAGRETGPWVGLWEKEGRWMRGEPVPGWRPYAEVKAQRGLAKKRRRERRARDGAGPGDCVSYRAAVARLAATLEDVRPQRLTERRNHDEQRDGTGERGAHHHT
jgi:hypothetical protein